jgi:hypothetical protein
MVGGMPAVTHQGGQRRHDAAPGRPPHRREQQGNLCGKTTAHGLCVGAVGKQRRGGKQRMVVGDRDGGGRGGGGVTCTKFKKTRRTPREQPAPSAPPSPLPPALAEATHIVSPCMPAHFNVQRGALGRNPWGEAAPSGGALRGWSAAPRFLTNHDTYPDQHLPRRRPPHPPLLSLHSPLEALRSGRQVAAASEGLRPCPEWRPCWRCPSHKHR